jgi:hypothetical protein
MTKCNLKALNAYFRAKSLTYEWTKESSNIKIKKFPNLWEIQTRLHLKVYFWI